MALTPSRYPLGTSSVGGPDGILTSLQDKIRRQSDPKAPPEGFKVDPWIVPTDLWTKAQTTEIQNYADSQAIRADAEDTRVMFDIQAAREYAAGKFVTTRRPLRPEERMNIEERTRVAYTLGEMQRNYPGVVQPQPWDDGTQDILNYLNNRQQSADGVTPSLGDLINRGRPFGFDEGTLRAVYSSSPANAERMVLKAEEQKITGGTGGSFLRDMAGLVGRAFDGKDFIGEMVAWTTAFADDPTLNPEDLSRNKAYWRQAYEQMYADLPRPAQIFIDETNPANIAITIGTGGLSTVLRASGGPIAKGVASVIEPIAANTFKSVPLEIAASTAARVGYEYTDGAPTPIRLMAGAAGAILVANPKAILSPTGNAVRTAWRGLTEPPSIGALPTPESSGTTLAGVFSPTPGRSAARNADELIPIPDVIDVPVPDSLQSYKSPVNFAATDSAQTALDRAADLQMQIGRASGYNSGQPVPGNAAYALARAQDALEFSGNNRFINALNFATDDRVVRQAYWAEQAASSEYAARVYPSRIKFLDYIERTFGSTRNLPDFMEYVGPQTRRLHGTGLSGPNFGTQVEAAAHPLTGTIYDAMMNPEYYTWGDIDESQFRRVLDWFNQRNLNANAALEGYGAEIGDFNPSEFFFPTINRQSQVATIANPDAAARAVSGRLRDREFSSIVERFMLPLEEQGGVFDPELDFANAFTALDNAKAMSAGRNTFRLGIGGSLEPQPGWIRVPALSNDLRDIFLPEEQAKVVTKYFDQGDAVSLFNYLNILKNTALNADGSPLTIQGSLAWFASPFDTTAQILKTAKNGDTFRAFTPEFMAEQVAKDPQGWTNFSFWMGMAPSAGTPQEFRTGLLEAIPGIGPKLGDWNDNVMSVLMQWMKREFDDQASMLVKEGFTQDQAYAAAADVVRMVIPMTDTRKLGITATGNIVQRGLTTSASFIRQPIEFMDEAFMGYLKLGAKLPDEVVGLIKGGSRSLDEIVPERQSMQALMDESARRIDEIDGLMRELARTAENEPIRAELRAERMVIQNSLKAMTPDLDTVLQEESVVRLASRAFSPGTREAWATLTPRERAAAQTFAKMAGGITGVAAVSAMLTANDRGLTPEEALQRSLPGQPDFWKVFLGPEFSVNIGGPLRSLAQAIMPGENGIPFENIGRYGLSKITPPLTAIGELIANEDYYGQEIRSGNFGSQVLDSLGYAARQVAPVSVVSPFELYQQGFSGKQIIAQSLGQFLGQNIVPPSQYERLERVRRTAARDLLANPQTWEARGMTQEQMNAARSARNLTELRNAIGTRAANHLVEFGNPEAEDAIDAYVRELRRRANGGDRDAEALLVSIDTQNRLEAQRQLSVDANGVLDKALYRSQRGQIIAEMVGRNEAFSDVFEGFGTSRNEVDRLSSEWYSLFDRATVTVDVGGQKVDAGVDYELFNQLEEQFFAQLGPEKAALVEANVAVAPRGSNPAETELRQVRSGLELSGFWDIEDDVWSTVRKGAISTVTSLMEAGALGERLTTDVAKELTASLLTAPTYGDFRTKVKEVLTQQYVDAGIAPETAVQIAKQKLGSLPDIRAIDSAISDAKVEWAVANQPLAESAIQWGYLSASEANIAASMLDKAQQAPAATGGAQTEPSGQGINSDAFKAPEKPKGGSSALSRMADDFTKNELSYTQLAEKYGLPSKGAAEQRLRRFFGESPLAVRERLRQSNP